MSGIFNDPPIFGGLYNANIQANRNTPLNLGSTQLENPSIVTEIGRNTTRIFFEFIAVGLQANYSANLLWRSINTNIFNVVPAISAGNNVYRASIPRNPDFKLGRIDVPYIINLVGQVIGGGDEFEGPPAFVNDIPADIQFGVLGPIFVVNATFTTITVQYNIGSVENIPSNRFEFLLYNLDNGTSIIYDTLTTVTPVDNICTFTFNLTNTNYPFTVGIAGYAYTTLNDSDEATTNNIVAFTPGENPEPPPQPIPEDQLIAPIIFDVVPEQTSFSFKFSINQQNLGRIDEITIFAADEEISVPVMPDIITYSQTINNLIPNSSYSFYITMSNEVSFAITDTNDVETLPLN